MELNYNLQILVMFLHSHKVLHIAYTYFYNYGEEPIHPFFSKPTSIITTW